MLLNNKGSVQAVGATTIFALLAFLGSTMLHYEAGVLPALVMFATGLGYLSSVLLLKLAAQRGIQIGALGFLLNTALTGTLVFLSISFLLS